MRFSVLFLSCLLSSTAVAFESWPEFRGLAAPEARRIDDPFLVDAEYNSDFLIYQKPVGWDAKMWQRGQGFDFTVGSLGGKEFLLDQRILLQAQLTERLRFRLIWMNDQDFEDDFATQKLELGYRIGQDWGVSGYGSLAFHKEENDVGVAVWRKRDDFESRLYMTLLDFQRNERNRETDRWGKNEEPKAFGIVVRRSQEDEHGKAWSEVGLRYEPRATWNFPDIARKYQYQRTSVLMKTSIEHADGYGRSGQLAFEDKFESEVFSAPATSGENQLRRQRAWFQYEEKVPLNDRGDFRFAINHFWRRYVGLGRDAVTRDWLPAAWWDYKNWSFGYDVDLRWADWNGLWSASDQDSFEAQHRLNVLHRWVFEQQGELALVFTFDLDRFGTDETWEGGAGRFSWFF